MSEVCKNMKRPIGVTIIAVLAFSGATILAVGACGLFFVALMGMTGGLSRLVLAGVAVCLAMGVLALREWARIAAVASIAAGIGITILSLFAVRRYVVLPAMPSIYFHLAVVTTSVWMLAYLLLPRVKQVFGAVTARPAH